MTDHVRDEMERARQQHVNQVLDNLSATNESNEKRRLLEQIEDAERRGNVREAVSLKRQLARLRGVSTV